MNFECFCIWDAQFFEIHFRVHLSIHHLELIAPLNSLNLSFRHVLNLQFDSLLFLLNHHYLKLPFIQENLPLFYFFCYLAYFQSNYCQFKLKKVFEFCIVLIFKIQKVSKK